MCLHFEILHYRQALRNCLDSQEATSAHEPTHLRPSRGCPLIVMFSPGKLDCIPRILAGSIP